MYDHLLFVCFLSACHLHTCPHGYSHLQGEPAMDTPGDSDLHAVDDYGYTPVVLAAASGSRKANCDAFQFLMRQYIGSVIQDVTKNPLFQALKVGDDALPAVKVRHHAVHHQY